MVTLYKSLTIFDYHCESFQTFFIDHTAKTTTFIDPRLPLELPILLGPTTDVAPLTPPVVYAGYAAVDSVLLTPTFSQVRNNTVNNVNMQRNMTCFIFSYKILTCPLKKRCPL